MNGARSARWLALIVWVVTLTPEIQCEPLERPQTGLPIAEEEQLPLSRVQEMVARGMEGPVTAAWYESRA